MLYSIQVRALTSSTSSTGMPFPYADSSGGRLQNRLVRPCLNIRGENLGCTLRWAFPLWTRFNIDLCGVDLVGRGANWGFIGLFIRRTRSNPREARSSREPRLLKADPPSEEQGNGFMVWREQLVFF